jgi:hypothetical protein
MTLHELLIAIASFAPLVIGIREGARTGVVGAATGFTIGLAVCVSWLAGLLAAQSYVARRVEAMPSHFWSELALSLFYGLVLMSGFVSARLALCLTKVVLS